MTDSVPQSFHMYCYIVNRLSRASFIPIGFFIQIVNDSIGTGRIVRDLDKETLSLSKNPVKTAPLAGAISFYPTQRNSAC